MKKATKIFSTLFIIILTNVSFAQGIKIGPRLTGNMNIYNQNGLTGTWRSNRYFILSLYWNFNEFNCI